MPQQFDIDPFGLSLSKPPAFPLTLRDRLMMQALQQARRRKQGAPLPSPSLVEPLWPFGMFGQTLQNVQPKTGFEPFHLPSQPKSSLRDLLASLLQGGQFGI